MSKDQVKRLVNEEKVFTSLHGISNPIQSYSNLSSIDVNKFIDRDINVIFRNSSMKFYMSMDTICEEANQGQHQ